MRLTIRAEAPVAMHIRQVAEQALDLARRTGCDVAVEINGVTMWASPDCSAETVYAEWGKDFELRWGKPTT